MFVCLFYLYFAGEIYSIDPSGCSSRYLGTAAGRNRPAAKTELEKLSLSSLSPQELGEELIRILMVLQEERQTEDKVEFEVSSLSIKEGEPVYELWVPDRVAAAVNKAKDAIEAMESD